MIRSPASRILLGPEDINYHLNRVLMRLAARYQVYSPEDSEYDGEVSNEPSIDDTGVSSASSLRSSSGYESAGSWSGSKKDQEDQYQDQPEGESRSSSSGSCIVHRETEVAHAEHYTWRFPLQSHRLTPGIDGREAWSADVEALALSPGELASHSLPLHSQVSSLRLLFETLSLNSLPSHNPAFYQKLCPVSRLGSENQGPVQSKNQFESELDIDSRMSKNPASQASSGTQNKRPSPIRQARAAQSDIAMEDAPALTSSTASKAESSDAVSNKYERTPAPVRKPRKIQKTEATGQTEHPTGQATKQATGAAGQIGHTIGQGTGKTTWQTARQTARQTSGTTRQTEQNIGQAARQATGQTARQTTGQVTGQTRQATGQAIGQVNRQTTGNAGQTGQGTGHTTRATSSSTPMPGASGQSTAGNTQGTVATRKQAAPSTQNQTTNTRIRTAPAVASNSNASNTASNKATTTESLTSALTPEKWTHMMDSSRAFHTHVQQMLAELDDEYDAEDEFGMRELRRRPAGAGAGAGRGTSN